MADDIGITIRTRGGRQSAQEARMVSTAIGTIGPAGRRAAAGVGALGRESVRTGRRGLSILSNQAQAAGFVIGGLGGLAIRSGIQFNASMEQSQVAFAHFLGGPQAARRELTELYSLAKATPFEFPQLVQATQRFLAFGFNVRESNALLKTTGDVVSGLGLGAEGIDRMVTAIGQIRSKGRLQGEELMQLQELGAVNTTDLRRRLHLTADEMANIGEQRVPATRALRALQAQWDDTFGGMSAQQAKTFSGQLSTLRDNTNQLLGTISRPAFNRLRDDVLPALNDLAGELGRTWGPKGPRATEMRLFQSRQQIQRALKPLEDEVGNLHLGRRFGDALDAAAPEIGRAAGRAAPHAAGAFVDAWMASGTWVQLGTVALGALKLASFIAKGAAMGRGFRLGWGTGVGTLPTPVAGVPGVPGGRGRGRGAGRVGRAGRGVARGLPILGTGVVLAEGINQLAPRPGESGNPEGVRAHGPRLPAGQSWWERTHRPRRGADPGPATNRTRAARGAAVQIPAITVISKIGEHEVARAVHRVGKDTQANRRGG